MVLVDIFDLGIYGIAWGTVITFAMNLIVVTVYCAYFRKDLKESYFFPTRECF